jgi:hypothetical protein
MAMILFPQSYLKNHLACLTKYVLIPLQDLHADVLLASSMYSCTQVLASRLDKPFVNYFPAGAIEPFMTSLWPGSNRRLFLSNPLSYFPQMDLSVTSQHLVRNLALGYAVGCLFRPSSSQTP